MAKLGAMYCKGSHCLWSTESVIDYATFDLFVPMNMDLGISFIIE